MVEVSDLKFRNYMGNVYNNSKKDEKPIRGSNRRSKFLNAAFVSNITFYQFFVNAILLVRPL